MLRKAYGMCKRNIPGKGVCKALRGTRVCGVWRIESTQSFKHMGTQGTHGWVVQVDLKSARGQFIKALKGHIVFSVCTEERATFNAELPYAAERVVHQVD